MLKNYLKITWRNLLKNKVYTLINIFGLAISITACLLIWQYVDFERSYDDFHENADRIFRIAMFKYEKGEAEQTFAFTYPAVAPNLKKDFAEVEEAIRIRRVPFIVNYEDQVYSEMLYFVDEPFLEMFSFPMLEGDPGTALEGQYHVAISESTARKYFGSENPMGKQLSMESNGLAVPFEVKAVFKDVPENSHIDFDFLLPYKTYSGFVSQFGGDAENNWNWSDFYTYVLLKPGVNPDELQAKLPGFIQNYKGEDFKKFNYEIALRLQPLNDIHLKSDLAYELEVNGNSKYVLALSVIGFFILIIAWINYINLATARSFNRAKEVGIRKVAGARKDQLIRQFLFETMLVNLIAFLLAILFFEVSRPLFSTLTGNVLANTLLSSAAFWWLASLIFMVGTLAAGLYPAFVLSSFKPIRALKPSLQFDTSLTGSINLRKGLVVFQFAASVALIAGTLALYRQIDHMRSADLGINIDQKLILRDFLNQDSTFAEKIQSFKSALLSNPGIKSFTASTDIPGKEVGWSWNLRAVNNDSKSLKRVRTFGIDPDFTSQYDMDIVAGRGFSRDFGTDANAVLLNETAVRVFGFDSPEAALNQEITNADEDIRFRVVGVLEDYHQEGLKYNFKPIVYRTFQSGWNFYTLQVQTADLPNLISFVERTWKTHFPNGPLNHFFLDEFFDRQYKADKRFGWILALCFILPILLACLGFVWFIFI